MSCPCDVKTFPPGRDIPPGLTRLPRQWAAFPEVRDAMLTALRSHAPLAFWRARGQDDLGIMLLEMWAYVCDNLAFYSENIAHETFLRTARRRPSLRKLVDLLGYLPRPAVAASVSLALIAEGVRPSLLAPGTAFRSGAFGAEPPQIFELDGPVSLSPSFNKIALAAPASTTLGKANPDTILVEKPRVTFEPDDLILVKVTDAPGPGQVARIAKVTEEPGRVRLKLTAALTLAAAVPLAAIRLFKPTQTASLWTAALPSGVGNPAILSLEYGYKTRIILDGLYRQIKTGQDLVFVYNQTLFSHTAEEVTEQPLQVTPDINMINDGDPFKIKGATAPATRILLSDYLDVNIVHSHLVIYYGLVNAGTFMVEPMGPAAANAVRSLSRRPRLAPGETAPARVFLSDAFETGVEIGGVLDPLAGSFTPDVATPVSPALHEPVTLYGNLAGATRGESVYRELLGVGNGALANQRFTLKKKPLTYVAAPASARGVASTLAVYVDGVRWHEQPGFFAAGPRDQVYLVRQDDKQAATIIFGDGIRGARLPSGSSVTADYRFGAGAAAPPAHGINQLARPVKGLAGVLNPVGAAGGADPEPADGMRDFAPRSALVLGRAVSIQDLEALAMGVPGVRAASAVWRWHPIKQRAVAQVFYLGQPGIEANVSQRLRSLSDPALAISVQPAMPIPVWMTLDVRCSKDFRAEDVTVAIRDALLDGEDSLLAPERVGIGKPLFRSHIFERVFAVPGVTALRGIYLYWWPFLVYAIIPGEGAYFDFELGQLFVQVQEEA